MAKGAFARGSQAYWRGYQDSEFGWPVGMPVCKPLGGGVYEVRSSLAQNRIGQMLFYVDKSSRMV